MANNIFIRRNLVHAKQTVNIVATGINSTNVAIIYSFLDDGSAISYKPGRPINQLQQFELGGAYLIQALQEMDLTAYLMPPFPVGGISLEDGSGGILPEDE